MHLEGHAIILLKLSAMPFTARIRRTLNVVVFISLSLHVILSLNRRQDGRRSTSDTRFAFLPDFGDMPHNDKVRILPMTGGRLTADWICNSTNGSFWLPQPPSDPISGYEVRMEGNSFETDFFKGRSGFMHPDKIDILMWSSFNAGDFYSLWIAPMIAGRKPNLSGDASTSKCSLAVVGSILQNGARYAWGPGFISSTNKLSKKTEKVFAIRGPISYELAKASLHTDAQAVSPVYGDPGLLISWYYQPHNQTKSYSLCLIPHYAETKALPLVDIVNRWKAHVHQVSMMDPIFHIMDDIVKCEFVLSSSLHGIIFADSYGIPNAHMNLTTRIVGGNHKFDDYFRSVNRTRSTLELINRTSVDMEEIQSIIDRNRRPLDINILPLWQNAPMHAQAYNRSREEHLEFARDYAKRFADMLHKKPLNLQTFSTKWASNSIENTVRYPYSDIEYTATET